MINFIKKLIKLSPIPLSKNHNYDIQTKRIIATLAHDANCIDIGVFKGEILDLFLQQSPSGHHFAFEPLPHMFEKLVDKYKANHRIHLYNYALSDKESLCDFNYVKTNPAYSGLQKRKYPKSDEIVERIMVKTNTLDNLLPGNYPISLIKIDVEGAEYQVLLGARNTIKKYKPIVVFEHGLGAADFYNTSPAQVFDFFRSLDMKVSNLGSFLSKKESLTKDKFETQFKEQHEFYYVAHS
jgi:FkbM family methyltransferase